MKLSSRKYQARLSGLNDPHWTDHIWDGRIAFAVGLLLVGLIMS